jgi:beta-glucosidase
MTNTYKTEAKKTRLGIPLLFAVDAVHGNNNMENTIIFPHNIGIGASKDTKLVGEIAFATAKELTAAGVDWTFSPCVAVSRDIRWGRTYESFGENPNLVSIMAIPYITTLQKQGIIACAKHYVADGAVEFGTGDSGYLMDQGNAIVNEKDLNDYYISVYREMVKAGVKTVMVSYSSINGKKNHSSKHFITEVLKEKMGFNGIVISDFEGVHQLEGEKLSKKVCDAVNAGIDVLMEGDSWKECYKILLNSVESRTISMKRIDDAVSRILRVKMEMGKFNSVHEDMDRDFTIKNSNSKQVAEKAVRESLVLLKNKNKVLPLNKQKTVAVIGPAADNIGVQCGGWTKTWQGGADDSYKGHWMSGTTVLDGFKEITSQSGGHIITDINKLKEADVVVVVLGEYPYAEGKGDEDNLGISGGTMLEGNEAALKAAYAAKKPIVVVLISGRPRIIESELSKWNSFVEAWLPGTEGGQIARVLYGDYEFKARLPVTWPRDQKQLPITVNIQPNGYNPQFPCGYGLNTDN